MSIHSIDRRARRTARQLRQFIDPETGDLTMKFKRNGQCVSTSPKDGAGEQHAVQARIAVCNCGGKVIDQRHVFPVEVPVTRRKHRSITASAAV